MPYLFTSESVSEGHPDKLADQISDALIDNFLAYDPNSKVACETLVTTGQVVLAGEVKSKTYLDVQKIAREVIARIDSEAKPGANAAPAAAASVPLSPAAGAGASASARKLSYKEQRELDALPARIEALEAEQRTIDAELADGLLFARHPQQAAELAARHAQIEDELMQALERWEQLSATGR